VRKEHPARLKEGGAQNGPIVKEGSDDRLMVEGGDVEMREWIIAIKDLMG